MKKHLALAAGLILGSSVALAADKPAFSDLDGDGDGMISQEEAMGGMEGLTEEDYATADQDGDGSLNEQEFELVNWPRN